MVILFAVSRVAFIETTPPFVMTPEIAYGDTGINGTIKTLSKENEKSGKVSMILYYTVSFQILDTFLR